jgi:uncharacterized LabA/DUF88 family protein
MVDYASSLDHIILFSGDGDFTYAIKRAQDRHSTIVSVISTETMMSRELVTQANFAYRLSEFMKLANCEWNEQVLV